MRMTCFLLAAFALVQWGNGSPVAHAQNLPPAERTPILVLNHAGPPAPVTCLAFSPDGSTLYVGGLDKLVRRYILQGGQFVAAEPLRVPVATGLAGAVNSVAVSPDGKWVAVAGRAPVRGEMWSGTDDGISINTRFLSKTMKQDFGVVYLFDPANPQGGRVIRGPESAVLSLAFANPAPAKGHCLITAGIEWDEANKNEEGVIRVFDVTTGRPIDHRRNFPTTMTRPGLGAWAVGDGVRIAVAWRKTNIQDEGELVVWDIPGGEPRRFPEGVVNFPLVVRHDKDGRAAEIITTSYDLQKNQGRLTIRAAEPIGNERVTPLPGGPGRAGPLPLGVATLTLSGVGDTTALLLRDTNVPPGGAAVPHELRLVGAGGKTLAAVPLSGVSARAPSVLAASPDGRFLAVAGFTDNRVEVYDTTKLAANQDAKLTTLPGAPGGFAGVSFLTGNKLWLGGPKDTPTSGGFVLDLPGRKAIANDGKSVNDSPPQPAVKLVPYNRTTRTPGHVSGTGFKEITLRPGFSPTAVALLPDKPAWNRDLAALVAVAQTHEENRQTIITLYEAATGTRVLDLDGPALPVESVAFSSSRPLLAAVGADTTAFVWSLRNLRGKLPALPGVTVSDRNGEVVIESIEPGSPALAVLETGKTIEAIGPEKGDLKAVKSPSALLLAVRGLRIGDKAQVKLKGQPAPVLVPVGASVGHRHPLLTVWVDPQERKGVHDWIGWTSAGPYDTSSEAAEARIGWVTATGNDNNPATFEGAKQHRGDFHKHDLLRYVIDEADFDAGFKKWFEKQPPPELALLVTLNTPTEHRPDGRVVTREKSTRLDVTLDDPRKLLATEHAVLRWRVLNSDGTTGAWTELPFSTGQASIDLTRHPWVRGQHRFEFALFRNRRATFPTINPIVAFTYIPPPPVVTLYIDGKEVSPGSEVATENPAVTVSVAVKPGPDGPANFTMSAGERLPVSFLEHWFGIFGGRRVPLKPGEKAEILVTARTIGDDVFDTDESHIVGVTVRHIPPTAPPRVSLRLVSPHHPRTSPIAPFQSDTFQVVIGVSVESQDPITTIEWDLGDGKGWVRDPRGAKAESRDITLPTDGTTRTIRARATSRKGLVGEDSIAVLYTALPSDAVFEEVPGKVTASQLDLTLRLENPGTVPFTVAVLVGSARADTREVGAVYDEKSRTWRASVSLTPGLNRLGVVIRNQFREVRKGSLAVVEFVRPPVLVAVPPVNAGVARVAPVVVTGLTPAGAVPTELLVNGMAVGFKPVAPPVRLLGLDLWTLRAEGIPVMTGDQPLEKLAVTVRNPDGQSGVRETKVVVMKPVPTPPPVINLSRGDAPLGEDQMSNKATFTFRLHISSMTPLNRVEVWHGNGREVRMEPLPGIDPTKARAVPGGVELELTPTVELRSGPNRFRVVAANSGGESATEFRVSYTQPGVRVQIDGIEVIGTDGKPVALTWPTVGPVKATGYQLRVRGRVVWDNDDDPVGHNPNLKVVFVANHVTHIGIEPKLPVNGKRERHFEGPVYIHARQSVVRVELRSGPQLTMLPQQGTEPFQFRVDCEKPLDRQRLHVLVIGVDLPDGERSRVDLARRVVAAVGGTDPGASANFDRGELEFEHPRFQRAMVYPPRVGYGVTKSVIDGLLLDVSKKIERARQLPEQDWINDVVVIYYEGRDLVGQDGLRRLHTSLTLRSGPAVAEAEAIPLDCLFPTPGLRCPVLNVVKPSTPQPALSPFAHASPLLRYEWANPTARELLLPIFRETIARQRTVGEVVDGVQQAVMRLPQRSSDPTDTLPESVRPRNIGLLNK